MIFLFLLYSGLLSYQITKRLPETIQTNRLFFGTVTFGLLSAVLTTVTYYIHAITPFTSGLILVLITLILYWIPVSQKHQLIKIIEQTQPISRFTRLIGIIASAVPIVLLIQLITARSRDVLVSPWHALPSWFFLLFAIGIASTIYYVSQSQSSRSSRLLTSAYLFIFYSVAAIVYVHGFGFDGFIHRATQEWIVQNGFIDPKTPYYIGQYSFLSWLALSTKIPVAWLDIYAVPVLSAILLPTFFQYTLRAYGVQKYLGSLFALLVPFAYFVTLNLTTPHNLVILLFILTVLSIAGAYKKSLPHWFVLLLALVALLCHPLLGVSLTLFASASVLVMRVKNKRLRTTIYVAMSAVLVALPSVLFSLNNWRTGFGWPELTNPFQNLLGFFSLFDRPYWYAETGGRILDLVYAYQRVIGPILVILALFALKKRKEYPFTLAAWIGFLSFFAAAWLLNSWLSFPGVAEAEQQHYPLRLIWASVLFLLPLSALGMHSIFKYLSERFSPKITSVLQIGCIGAISILLMLSFYFSYPQRNAKVFFPGYNVTDADVEAVQWIHSQHQESKYIVLSSSLTSVAALSEYGFLQHFETPEGEIFYYAIPTGGPLYAYYLEMIHEDQQRKTMLEAMDLAGVDTAYFTLNSYWDEYSSIVEGATQSANQIQSIQDGKVMIFRYDR